MAKMYLMCGCSGAGKTTFSKSFAQKHNIKYLGIDDFYAVINGDECNRSNTFEVWIEFFKAIHNAEIHDIDCIVDTNALTVCHRLQFIEWFPTFEHHLIYIEAESELRKKNNLSRRRQVPDDVMDKMEMQLEVPFQELDKNWDSIVLIKNIDNNFSEPITLIDKDK